MARRIKVKGIMRSEIDTEQLALVYWLKPSGSCAKARTRTKGESEALGAETVSADLTRR